MNKKIYRYGVRFPITTTAWITLTRNENDIPVKDLMFSVSEDELGDCCDWDDIPIFEDAKWTLEEYKSQSNFDHPDTLSEVRTDDFEILEVEEDEASDSEIIEMLQAKLHRLQQKQRTSSTREENE